MSSAASDAPAVPPRRGALRVLAGAATAVAAGLAGCVIAPLPPARPEPPVEEGPVVAVPPPPPQAEVIGVAPGPAYVWVGGYWTWHLGRHVWIGGRWVLPPPRGYWVAPRWAPYPGGWRWRRGYWGYR